MSAAFSASIFFVDTSMQNVIALSFLKQKPSGDDYCEQLKVSVKINNSHSLITLVMRQNYL